MKFKLNTLSRNRGDSSVAADDTVSVSYLESEKSDQVVFEEKNQPIEEFSHT